MKKAIFLCILIVSVLGVSAQEGLTLNPAPDSKPQEDVIPEREVVKPTTFMSLNTGINNFTGLIGPAIEFGISDGFALQGGVGLASWGARVSLGMKIYKKYRYPYGSAFYLNLSHSTGAQLTNFEVAGDGKTYNMDLELNTLKAAHLGWEYIARITNNSRFHFQLGYCLRFPRSDGQLYKITRGGSQEDQFFKDLMSIMAPGGINLGLGISFKL